MSNDTQAAPHVPAAFINALAEEGTREELVKYLQQTWNELCQARSSVQAPTRDLIEAALYANIKSGFNGYYGVPEAASAILTLLPRPQRDVPQSSELAIENEQLRRTIQLHAGDAQSLSGEVDMWRERALEAEKELARLVIDSRMKEALLQIATWPRQPDSDGAKADAWRAIARAALHPCGECHIIPGETCDICGRTWIVYEDDFRPLVSR